MLTFVQNTGDTTGDTTLSILAVTVGSKIIRALEIVRVKKPRTLCNFMNKYLSNHDLWALCCL